MRDCRLEGDDSPLTIRNCEDNAEGVGLHNVAFVNHTHSSQPVALHYAKSSSCGTLEMTDTTFYGNQANGSVPIARLGCTTIMKNVRIEDSKRTDNGTGAVFVVTASGRQNDSVSINGLVATRNQTPVLRAKSGIIEISNSDFRGNDLGTQGTSMLKFSSSSKIVVRNCTFANNTGEGRGMITLERVASIEILHSKFTSNTRFGSMIFSTLSELKIQDSHFTSNNGVFNGGVVYMANSTARLHGTFFKDNKSGENGGAIYAVTNSTLTVTDSKFMKNEARDGGCFFIKKSSVKILQSTFNKNKADVDGGAILLEQGGCICKDSEFAENEALDDGGAFNIVSATYVEWQNITFRFNNAAFGSAVRIVKSRTNVNWNDVSFHNGVVGLTGAGGYIDDSKVTIVGAIFKNNTAPYGGAIYAQSFDITIKNAEFLNNSAHVMGGAISGDNGTISFENATFFGNNSTMGGALHFYNTTFKASAGLMCKESVVTIGPRRGIEPKIPPSVEVDPDHSFGIYAHNNRGIDSGGAIDAKVSNMTINYGSFSKNQAPDGGAIQFTSSEQATLSISHSEFQENIADVRGGGVAVRSTNKGSIVMALSSTHFSACIAKQGGAVFLTSVNAVIEDGKFVNNTAAEGGAALFQKNLRVISDGDSYSKSANISIVVKNCLFKRNEARVDGGALKLIGEIIVNRSQDWSTDYEVREEGFNVALESVELTHNQAFSSGGGVYAKAVNLAIQSVKVRGNNASTGGGIYLKQTIVDISDNIVTSNQAQSSGGGIMMAKQSNGTLASTNFIHNSILMSGDGGGLSLSGSNIRAQNLIFERNNAAVGGGVSLMPGSKRSSHDEKPEVDSRFLCFDCTFEKNKASTSGGGLNIQAQDSGVPVVAQLEKCQFEHNSASVYGGGVHFVRSFNQTKCKTDWASCSHLVILNTSFIGNKADRGGGSLLSNDRHRVIFSCSDSDDDTSSLEFINKTSAADIKKDQNSEGSCPQWVEGESCAKKISPLVSSYARKCNVSEVRGGKWSETDNNCIEIYETVPGERLPDILIECYDEFDHLAKSGDDGFKAILESKEESSLMGIFVTDLTDGIGKFTGVRNPSKESFNGSYSYAG